MEREKGIWLSSIQPSNIVEKRVHATGDGYVSLVVWRSCPSGSWTTDPDEGWFELSPVALKALVAAFPTGVAP